MAIAACAAASIKLGLGPRTVDDAYITMRYVSNLTAGYGLVYNPGERVLGTTSPLYALVLSIGSMLGARDLPLSAYALNMVLDAINLVLVFALCRALRVERYWSALASVAYGISASFAYYACSGLETTFFLFWELASLVAWLGGADRSAYACAGLGTLTRPEGVLLIASFFALDLLDRRRVPLAALAALAPLAAWSSFAVPYYGSPIPHAIVARMHPIYDPVPAFHGVQRLAGHCIRFTGNSFLPLSGYVPHYAVGAIWLAAFWSALCGRRRRALALPLFAALLWLVYGVANRVLFDRYLVPLEPIYLVVGIAGLFHATAGLAKIVPGSPRSSAFVLALISLVVIVKRLREFEVTADTRSGIPRLSPIASEYGPIEGRETVYLEAVRRLDAEATDLDVIALPEIGTVGYFFRGRVLDTVGIVSPISLDYYPLAPELKATNNAVPPQLIRDIRPRYVASLDVFIRKSLLATDWFRRDYELAFSLPTTYFESRDFLVFRRRATP